MKAKEYTVAYGEKGLQSVSRPMTLPEAIAAQADIERVNPDYVSVIRPAPGKAAR